MTLNHISAPVLNKAEFEFNNETKVHLDKVNVNNSDLDLNGTLSELSRISPVVAHSQTRLNVGAPQTLGVKRHRTIISFPKPNRFLRARSSSPATTLYRSNPKGVINGSQAVNTSSDPVKQKRSNSTISAAGAGIRQGLVNIGKFLQAAQYVITLTLVFSIAWCPLLAVVCADTMTRNFNEGFHKVEG